MVLLKLGWKYRYNQTLPIRLELYLWYLMTLLLAIQSLSGCAALKEEANKDANKRYKENAGRCYLFFPNSSYEWSDRSESAQTFCRVRSLTMLQSSNQFRITPWGQCRKFKFHIAYDHISNFFPAFLRILDLTLLLWRQMRKIASWERSLTSPIAICQKAPTTGSLVQRDGHQVGNTIGFKPEQQSALVIGQTFNRTGTIPTLKW